MHSLILTSNPLLHDSAWDSGCPVVLEGDNGPHSDILVGLGSWGQQCADPFFPGKMTLRHDMNTRKGLDIGQQS